MSTTNSKKIDVTDILTFFELVKLIRVYSVYKTTRRNLQVNINPDCQCQAVIKTSHMLTVFCTYPISVINLVNMQTKTLTKGLQHEIFKKNPD